MLRLDPRKLLRVQDVYKGCKAAKKTESKPAKQ
jgi:hypothetical protein